MMKFERTQIDLIVIPYSCHHPYYNRNTHLLQPFPPNVVEQTPDKKESKLRQRGLLRITNGGILH